MATGRLGWPPDQAMAADPQLVLLAWSGHCEEVEDFERVIYGAQGIKLPEKPNPKRAKGKLADRFREFAIAHNAAFRARKGAPKTR